jgi:hypothetical protein
MLLLSQSILAVGAPAALLDLITPAAAEAGSQNEWRFCTKCHVMFYNGYAISQNNPTNTGRCAAGGSHLPQGWEFFLDYDSSRTNNAALNPGGVATKQYDWRFCNRCFSLFWAGDTRPDGKPGKRGVCPVGGAHQEQGFNFGLYYTTNTRKSPRNPDGAYQNSWRFCGNCFALFYNGYSPAVRCPAPNAPNGQHAAIGFEFHIAFKDIPPKNGPPATLATILVQEGQKLLNKCVKTDLSTQTQACPTPPNPLGIGDGECTHFVQLAVKNAGARAPIFDNNLANRNYNWGTKITSTNLLNDIQPGDILQLWEATFRDPRNSNNFWGPGNSSDPVNNPNHHTALAVSKNGNMVTVLEQNAGSPQVRLVQSHVYDFSWPHTGDVFIYRVVKA